MPEKDGENLHEVLKKVANLLDASDTGDKNVMATVYRGRHLKMGLVQYNNLIPQS
jgi:hypothetical protein